MDSRVWDVALSPSGEVVQMRIPAEVSRALRERGLNRARLSVTDAGILLVPYVGVVEAGKGSRREVELPDWGNGVEAG